MSDVIGRNYEWRRGPRPTISERRTHIASMYGPDHGKWGARCVDCVWRVSPSKDRLYVRAALDSHLIFHHRTGSYLCTGGHCSACKVIKRLRSECGVQERMTARTRQSALRNVGKWLPEWDDE